MKTMTTTKMRRVNFYHVDPFNTTKITKLNVFCDLGRDFYGDLNDYKNRAINNALKMGLKYSTSVYCWDDFNTNDVSADVNAHMSYVVSKNFNSIFDNIDTDIILPDFLKFNTLKGDVIKINPSGLVTDTGFIISKDMIDLSDFWYGKNYDMIFYYLYHHL